MNKIVIETNNGFWELHASAQDQNGNTHTTFLMFKTFAELVECLRGASEKMDGPKK